MKDYIKKLKSGITIYGEYHFKSDIRKYFKKNKNSCSIIQWRNYGFTKRLGIIKKCSKRKAINIAQWFLNNEYNDSDAVWYNNDMLYLYCSHAGSGMNDLIERTKFHINHPKISRLKKIIDSFYLDEK